MNADDVSRKQITLRERRVTEMKTTWNTLAIALLIIGGGIGVTTWRSLSKSPAPSVAAMSDTMMVSMQSEMSSCGSCQGNDQSKCVLGGCSLTEGMAQGSMAQGMMAEGMMADVKMADGMSPSMSDMKMGDTEVSSNDMASKMDSGTNVDSEMQASPKM